MQNEQQSDGSTVLGLTSQGLSLLPRDVQQQIAADPGSYSLSDDARQWVGAMQNTPAVKKAIWQNQQVALLNEFPEVGLPGSSANQTFIRAFRNAGGDPRKAVQVARAVLGR